MFFKYREQFATNTVLREAFCDLDQSSSKSGPDVSRGLLDAAGKSRWADSDVAESRAASACSPSEKGGDEPVTLVDLGASSLRLLQPVRGLKKAEAGLEEDLAGFAAGCCVAGGVRVCTPSLH